MCKCKIILHEFHTLTLTPFPTNLYIYKTCMMQQIHTFVCQVEGKMVDGFFFVMICTMVINIKIGITTSLPCLNF